MTAPGSVLWLLLRRLVFSFAIAWPSAATTPAQTQPDTGTRELDDITYALASEWVNKEIKAGPDLRAHYVLEVRGRPYAELYVSSEKLPGPGTLEQVLQAGIEKGRGKLTDYRPMGTRRTRVGDLDAIVHDFGYFVGTPFRGRIYVLVVGDTSYSFFFNTAEGYFSSVENVYSTVAASIRRRKKPDLPAANAAPATVEEHGLLIDLPAGWRPSGDAAGAKYRSYDAAGQTVASFFPLRSDVPMFEHFGPLEPQVDGFIKQKRAEFAQQFDNFVEGPSQRLKVGELDVRSIEFTCKQGNMAGFFRWYFVPLKDKEDDATTRYPHMMRQFGFFTTQGDRLADMKAQFEAIIKTLRKQGAAPVADKPATDLLPALEPEGEQPGLFRDPAGRFVLPLPDGAKLQGQDNAHSSYALAAKDAKIELWNLQRAEDATARVAAIAQGRKQNGAESTWQVSGSEARVRVYTAKNDAGEALATVVANYPATGLVIAVELPTKGYAAAQPWITAFLKGLRLKD